MSFKSSIRTYYTNNLLLALMLIYNKSTNNASPLTCIGYLSSQDVDPTVTEL